MNVSLSVHSCSTGVFSYSFSIAFSTAHDTQSALSGQHSQKERLLSPPQKKNSFDIPLMQYIILCVIDLP